MKYKIPSWLLAFCACLLWSTAFVGVKYSLGFAPPIFIAGLRFFLAGVVLMPFAWRQGYIREFRAHYKVILTVSFLQTFMVYLLFYLSLSRIKASTGAALVGLGPMLGAILGYIFIKNERFTKRKIFSFILGISGVTLVSLSGGEGGALPGTQETIGIFMFILSSISGVFSNITVLRYKESVNSSVLTSAQLTIGGLMLTILSTFIYDDLTLIQPIGFYIALTWLVFVSAAGFSIWYYLLAKRRESLISMNIWKFVMPVSGGILGWVLMPDDSPTIKSVTGMLTVAISIFIYYRKKRP